MAEPLGSSLLFRIRIVEAKAFMSCSSACKLSNSSTSRQSSELEARETDYTLKGTLEPQNGPMPIRTVCQYVSGNNHTVYKPVLSSMRVRICLTPSNLESASLDRPWVRIDSAVSFMTGNAARRSWFAWMTTLAPAFWSSASVIELYVVGTATQKPRPG